MDVVSRRQVSLLAQKQSHHHHHHHRHRHRYILDVGRIYHICPDQCIRHEAEALLCNQTSLLSCYDDDLSKSSQVLLQIH